MKPIIDYLAFTIKSYIGKTEPANVDKDFIFKFLNLDAKDFIDIGRVKNYEHCYTSNSISVCQPYEKDELKQGWHVSMTGHGCRYYEQIQKDGEYVDLWREFLTRLRDLNNQCCKVNPTRIDIACDDFDGVLNINDIWDCAVKRNFVSQFRCFSEEIGSRRNGTKEGIGQTIYFGSRKSNTFCRFYDKKIEQIQKNGNDTEKLKELVQIPHWIRMEFEFKKEMAVKIINIICDADNFGKYYAKVVNSNLRFVDNNDINVTRRTVKNWWKKFTGTIRRAKLSVGQYKSFSYNKMLKYYDRYLATTIYTILSRMDIEEFLMRTYNMGYGKLKRKHLAIMNDISCTYELSPSQWWDFLNPIRHSEREAYA